jgi:hypothetical protein
MATKSTESGAVKKRTAFAAAAALALGVAPALAQTQFGPGPAQQIQPISAPVALDFRSVPRFRFAVEVVNQGVPLPSSPMRALAEGAGRAIAAGRRGAWTLSFDRLTLDGTPIVGAGPLAVLDAQVDPASPERVSYRADYRGIRSTPPGAGNAGIQMILGQIVDTTAFSLFVPPQAPVAAGAPVADLNAAMQRFLSRSRLGAQLLQAASAAMPVGTLDHHGRQALLVRQMGPLAVRIMNVDLPMQSEAMGIIDQATGLPLFISGRLTGQSRLPFANGMVNYLIRMAAAVDGMPDPVQQLQPPTPPPGQTLPPSAAAPPLPPPMQQPPAAPAAAPAPRPAPPPAAAPPASQPMPAGLSALQQQRLQSLKGIYDQGLISREQYEQRQREILAGQ